MSDLPEIRIGWLPRVGHPSNRNSPPGVRSKHF